MTSRFVQVSKPNGPFEIVEQDIPDPGERKFASRFKPAAFATVILP